MGSEMCIRDRGDNQQVNQIVEGWQAQVPGVLEQYLIKKETIEQKVYQSSASLQEVVDFYKQQISTANGWVEARQMPGLQSGLFLNAYDHGSISLVIGAFDAAQVGGQGTVVYLSLIHISSFLRPSASASSCVLISSWMGGIAVRYAVGRILT